MRTFTETGAKHIIGSTGRLSKKSASPDGSSLWQRVWSTIHSQSPEAARRFEQEYSYERGGTSQGYLLRKDIRLSLHNFIRTLAEENGMTYSTCQELSAAESDSIGLPHCERFILPFSRKGTDGRFRPIEGCTANCHVACRNLPEPPCGRPELASPRPFHIGSLK